MQQHLTDKILGEFQPHFVQVENESHLHRSGKGANSHFKCVIVSAAFEGMPKVRRHQRVYALLAAELAGGIHALALHLYSPSEWVAAGGQFPLSPSCAGVGQSSLSA